MIILGITHPISWNSAACILVDGQMVAMAEEERFNRIKHSPRIPPRKAMAFCLEKANVNKNDVDYVAIGWDRAWQAALGNLETDTFMSSLNQTAQWLRRGMTYDHQLPLDEYPKKKIIFVNHHLSHAASAFYPSGFEEANILSLDGSGGSESGILAVGRGTDMEIFHKIGNRGSWGLAYELFTDALGFRRHSGEGKVMGLAAYGTPDPNGLPFIDWDEPIPKIIPKQRQQFLANLTPRKKHEPLTTFHKNLAATLQDSLERAGMRMVEWLYEKTGLRQLCLTGGVALNCSMNGKLALLSCVDKVFIQPAAHDAGTALGAALIVHVDKMGERPSWQMKHAYWGAEYTNDEIAQALSNYSNIRFHMSNDIYKETSELIESGKIVGWFQGRFELGPRALGNRSILANPSLPDMKDKINNEVKHREPWRPFAPSVLEEEIARYVSPIMESPYMILAFDTKSDKKSELKSAIHVDNTCRPQTVSKTTNLRYWQLIKQFEKRTGIPAILNTSFNVDGQPINCQHPTRSD